MYFLLLLFAICYLQFYDDANVLNVNCYSLYGGGGKTVVLSSLPHFQPLL